MNKLIQILIVVLIGQICLAAVLSTSLFNNQAEQDATKKIIEADLKPVDSIKLEEKDSEPLVLKKENDQWVVPARFNFPAASKKIEELKKKFVDMDAGWPVATTDDSAKRFKVEKDKFERKVTFLSGDKALAAIIVGTSPSFKKRHVRNSKNKEIYSVDLSPYEISVKPRDWLNKSIYTLDPDKVKKVVLPQFTLLREKGKWVLEGIASGKVTNQAKANQAFNTVAGIVFSLLEGNKSDSEYGLEEPALVYEFVLADGKKVEYKFGKRKVNDGFILKTSDKPFYVSVSKYTVENIQDLKRDGLEASKKAPVTSKKKSTDDNAKK